MLSEQNTMTGKAERQRRETLYWALVLIWAGLVFAAERLGILPQVGRADAWNWVFFGAGLLALLWSIRRAVAPNPPSPTGSLWNFVWAGILLILALSPLAPVKIGFPLILLLLGAALLVARMYAADKSPA